MNNHILRGLYNGQIIPWERHTSNSDKQRELLRKLDSEERYFIEKMSLDDSEQFQKLVHLHTELAAAEEDDVFAYSFTLSLLLMMDVMKEAEGICKD